MKKKPKPRNPVARELRDPKFRPRVVKPKKGTIPRRKKHRDKTEGQDDL